MTEFDFLNRLKKFLEKEKKMKRWRKITSLIALVVSSFTIYILIYPALAASNNTTDLGLILKNASLTTKSSVNVETEQIEEWVEKNLTPSIELNNLQNSTIELSKYETSTTPSAILEGERALRNMEPSSTLPPVSLNDYIQEIEILEGAEKTSASSYLVTGDFLRIRIFYNLPMNTLTESQSVIEYELPDTMKSVTLLHNDLKERELPDPIGSFEFIEEQGKRLFKLAHSEDVIEENQLRGLEGAYIEFDCLISQLEFDSMQHCNIEFNNRHILDFTLVGTLSVKIESQQSEYKKPHFESSIFIDYTIYLESTQGTNAPVSLIASFDNANKFPAFFGQDPKPLTVVKMENGVEKSAAYSLNEDSANQFKISFPKMEKGDIYKITRGMITSISSSSGGNEVKSFVIAESNDYANQSLVAKKKDFIFITREEHTKQISLNSYVKQKIYGHLLWSIDINKEHQELLNYTLRDTLAESKPSTLFGDILLYNLNKGTVKKVTLPYKFEDENEKRDTFRLEYSTMNYSTVETITTILNENGLEENRCVETFFPDPIYSINDRCFFLDYGLSLGKDKYFKLAAEGQEEMDLEWRFSIGTPFNTSSLLRGWLLDIEILDDGNEHYFNEDQINSMIRKMNDNIEPSYGYGLSTRNYEYLTNYKGERKVKKFSVAPSSDYPISSHTTDGTGISGEVFNLPSKMKINSSVTKKPSILVRFHTGELGLGKYAQIDDEILLTQNYEPLHIEDANLSGKKTIHQYYDPLDLNQKNSLKWKITPPSALMYSSPYLITAEIDSNSGMDWKKIQILQEKYNHIDEYELTTTFQKGIHNMEFKKHQETVDGHLKEYISLKFPKYFSLEDYKIFVIGEMKAPFSWKSKYGIQYQEFEVKASIKEDNPPYYEMSPSDIQIQRVEKDPNLNAVSKKGTFDPTSSTVSYEVMVNPSEQNMNPNLDTIILEDDFHHHIHPPSELTSTLIPDSIEVYDGYSNGLLDRSDYKYRYSVEKASESSGEEDVFHRLQIIVPDERFLIVRYKYKFGLPLGKKEQVTLNNSIWVRDGVGRNIKRPSSVEMNIEVTGNDLDKKIHFYVVDKNDYSQKFGNVSYLLYEYDGASYQKVGTLSSNTDGLFEAEAEPDGLLTYNREYKLVQSNFPNGYTANPVTHFYLRSENDPISKGPNFDTALQLRKSDNVFLENDKNIELKIIKEWKIKDTGENAPSVSHTINAKLYRREERYPAPPVLTEDPVTTELKEDILLGSSFGWQTTKTDLPSFGVKGSDPTRQYAVKYTYIIKEEKSQDLPQQYYEVSYQNQELGESGTMKIINTVHPGVIEALELPNTGGRGVHIYLIIGVFLIAAAIIAQYTNQRRYPF